MINHSDKKVKPKICSYISDQLFKGRMQKRENCILRVFDIGDGGHAIFRSVKLKKKTLPKALWAQALTAVTNLETQGGNGSKWERER